MKRLSVSAFLLFALIALTASFGFAADYGDHAYKTELTGKGEVPPVETMAKGTAEFVPVMNGKELRFKVTVEGIENVTASHIHIGKTGENGPVVAGLFIGPKKEGKFSGTLAEGTITDKDLVGPLSGKTVKELIAMLDKGGLYVNVHTTKKPGGEIRGELK